MAITLDIKDDAQISLQNYISYLQSGIINFDDEEAIVNSAFMLKRLCNNRHFLAELINNGLQQVDRYQSSSAYNALIYLLHAEKDFSVRAAIWPAESYMQSASSFLYGILHDHNFHILTCGYHGPGYKSRIFCYDYTKVRGLYEEDCPLKYEQETVLSEGKLMYLSAAKDVHVQIPPDALSISINLIVNSSKHHKLQCDFNPETHSITMQASAEASLITLAKMAGHLGNHITVDILKKTLITCVCPKAKTACYQALLKLDQANRTTYLKQAQTSSKRVFYSLSNSR